MRKYSEVSSKNRFGKSTEKMYFCNPSFSTIVLAIFRRFFTYSICNFYAESLIFSTNTSAHQTFSRASLFPHWIVVVGSLRGELSVGICTNFISTFADHQRRALVHFLWTGQDIAILRRARARQSWWASTARLVAQTQFFSIPYFPTVWGNAKREGRTSKIMSFRTYIDFSTPTNWPYKSNAQSFFP